eukprot:Awhi_evm1s10147
MSFAVSAGSGGKDHFPGPCSIRTALTHYLDIAQLPKPHQLRVLAEYAEAEDQERLLFLSSEEGHDEYNNYQAGDHVGIYPANPVDYVDRLGKALDTDLDTIVSLCPID